MTLIGAAMFLLLTGPLNEALDSHANLVQPGEPGEPMAIEGRVFDSDGKTPLAGVKLFIYHTCKDGDYHRDKSGKARINATVVTDGTGRFGFLSIRPGAYPGGGVAQHVHVELEAPDKGKRVTEFHFMDDPQIQASSKQAAERQGRFRLIIALSKDATGTWHGEWNYKF